MFIIRTNKTYDNKLIYEEYIDFIQSIDTMAAPLPLHINIKKRHQDNPHDAFHRGAASLYDYKQNKYIYSESEWDDYADMWEGSYIKSVVEDITLFAKDTYKVNIGRARLNVLPPKKCLSLHKDFNEEFRFHLPIITSHASFFVNDDQVGRMPDVGCLYTYKTSMLHTAVNAGAESRVHLVLSTWK